MKRWIVTLLPALVAAACGSDDGDRDADAQDRQASVYVTGPERLSREQLEAGRMEMDWRQFIERDTAAPAAGDTTAAGAAGSPANTEKWEDISAATVNSGPALLPVFGDVAGPSVLRVQVLLDRALFSPGVIDGSWGRNTEKAVYWMQKREGLRGTGSVDEATWQRLQQLAGEPGELVRRHTLSADEVAGPFVSLPDEYYARRDMDCQCYESLSEKLAERFHTTEELLAQLNPDVDLDAVTAGSALVVPAVDTRAASGPGTAAVAKIVISDGGRYLHALDSNDRIVYHFPATLGSSYSPSPEGDYRVTNIVHDPTWHYQPDLLAGVDDSKPDAVLPPGPNNAVGVVWMALSKPHFGIHGTSAPETIGYAVSNGCVRLTNWDAEFLGHRIQPGVPVIFRDVTD